MIDDYEDIIELERFDPKNHKRMSREERAFQFAPFAALSGYEESIKETARLTNKKQELTEEMFIELNNNLMAIEHNIKKKPLVLVSYFVPDKYKSGGEYIEKTGNIKNIDLVNEFIKFVDNEVIKIDDILYIKIYDKINL